MVGGLRPRALDFCPTALRITKGFEPTALRQKPQNAVNHLRTYFQKVFKNGPPVLLSVYTFAFQLSRPGPGGKHVQGQVLWYKRLFSGWRSRRQAQVAI